MSTNTFNSSMDNHYQFIFNLPSTYTNGTTSTQEIQLEKYQTVVIESLHTQVKSLYMELEETNTLLEEMKQINNFNLEKVDELKDEREKMREKEEEKMREVKEEVEKLEEKLRDHQEVIKTLIDDKFKEEPSNGPTWSTTHSGLTIYGYQSPRPPLQPYPTVYPFPVQNGKPFVWLKLPGQPEKMYSLKKGIYKLDDLGYKQRPCNYYDKPARKFEC